MFLLQFQNLKKCVWGDSAPHHPLPGLRQRVLHDFGLNPQTVIEYHWLVFLKNLAKNLIFFLHTLHNILGQNKQPLLERGGDVYMSLSSTGPILQHHINLNPTPTANPTPISNPTPTSTPTNPPPPSSTLSTEKMQQKLHALLKIMKKYYKINCTRIYFQAVYCPICFRLLHLFSLYPSFLKIN